MGKRDKEIKLVVEQNKDGETGAIAAKEIATEVDNSNEAYQYGKEKEIDFRVPPKFIKDGKLEEKRTKLNSADNLKSYSDAGMKAGLDFFKNNKFTKLKSFIDKDKNGVYVGFKGAGAMVVNHISLLGDGATDSICLLYTSDAADE